MKNRKKERQFVTKAKIKRAESAKLKGRASNKLCNGLTGNRFEMPNVSYTHPLWARLKKTTVQYEIIHDR